MSILATKSGSLAVIAVLISCSASAQGPAIALSSSPNPSILGQPVLLTATLPGATGRVTFYDGATILGTSPISNGVASITTSLLISGSRSLGCHYGGDATHAASGCPTIAQSVWSKPGAGFRSPAPYAAPYNSGPALVAVADFNADGYPDIAFTSAQSPDFT